MKHLKKPVVEKAQTGKKLSSKSKGASTLPNKYMLSPTSPKNIRYEGANTGVSAPSYMLDQTGNALPKYDSIIKNKLRMKNKLQAGGVVKPANRVGPVDPNGAWTKIQERTLAGAKVKKVPLTKDKELDASPVERRQAGDVAKNGKWIQKAIKKPGALRAQLGAKKGEPIAAGKLAAAAKKGGKLGQRARLAQTLKKMNKK
jgi:hypothetical protein